MKYLKIILKFYLVLTSTALYADDVWERCTYLAPETVQNFINIVSRETPRQILEEDYYSKIPNSAFGGSIPISGGWGYTQESSVIIDKNDPVVNQSMPFDGVGIEYSFIENRIYEELIIFKTPQNKFRGIKWKQLNRKTLSIDGKWYDHHRYVVTGHLRKDWDYLKNIFTKNNGFQDDPDGLQDHLREKDELAYCYETDYWFDITSFYGM